MEAHLSRIFFTLFIKCESIRKAPNLPSEHIVPRGKSSAFRKNVDQGDIRFHGLTHRCGKNRFPHEMVRKLSDLHDDRQVTQLYDSSETVQ